MTDTGSRLLLGVAAVLAGTAVLLAVFGFVYNPLLLLAALPFGVATYFLWGSATGRLDARMRAQAGSRRAADGAGATAEPGGGFRRAPRDPGRSGRRDADASRRPPGGRDGPTPSRADAASVLGVAPDAGEVAVRRAFREKARELHPDAPDGDEAEFRRVREAYERLRADR